MENVAVENAFCVLDTFPPPDVWTAPGYDQPSGSVEDGSFARNTLPDCLADKSPVSLLQELCMKRGLTVYYELIESEGPVHQRTFTYRSTAGSFTANGKGNQ